MEQDSWQGIYGNQTRTPFNRGNPNPPCSSAPTPTLSDCTLSEADWPDGLQSAEQDLSGTDNRNTTYTAISELSAQRIFAGRQLNLRQQCPHRRHAPVKRLRIIDPEAYFSVNRAF